MGIAFMHGRTRLGARCWGLAALLALLAWGLPAAAGAAPEPIKVSVQLLWVHQAQFAGFYLAQDRGLYRAQGLEVTIKAGGPGISPLKELWEGKCDFACAWLADALQTSAAGHPVVNLAQFLQRSALLLVAHADSDLESVRDLNGQRVSLWDAHFTVAPHTLFRRLRMGIKEVRQGAGIALFMDRAVMAASAMRYNELHQLYQAGLDPDEVLIFDFAEMGLNFPEDGLYAREAFWREHPDLCRKFTRATLEGWRLAMNDPKGALEAVMRRVDQARLASNLPHQRWMLKTIQELITFGLKPGELGRLDPTALDILNRALVSQKFIDRPVPAGDIITDAWRERP